MMAEMWDLSSSTQRDGLGRRAMARIGVLAIAVLVTASAAPAAASVVGALKQGVDPCTSKTPVASGLGDPFGFIDGPLDPTQNTLTGVVPLFGWALDDDGVAAVDVLVDGIFQGRAEYGFTRADVAAVFPGFPDGALSGWQFQLDTTNFLNGTHTVSAQVISDAGEVMPLNSVAYVFNNSSHNLAPFGKIEFPKNNAQVFGACDLENPRRYAVVEGWALDAGVEQNDHGVGFVELLIDGSIFANSRLNCRHSPVTGAHTNCYGKTRLDIEQRFPGLKDAPNAGFRFVMDVGLLVSAFGFAEGNHTLTVRVGDIDSQVTNVDSINVNFFCDDFLGDPGSIGSIDLSPERPRASGELELEGWALDDDGVELVKIFVDGKFAGNAVYGFPRPDISSRFPGFPDSNAPGWIFTLDTRPLSTGPHSVQVIVEDQDGNDTIVGEGSFEVLNP